MGIDLTKAGMDDIVVVIGTLDTSKRYRVIGYENKGKIEIAAIRVKEGEKLEKFEVDITRLEIMRESIGKREHRARENELQKKKDDLDGLFDDDVVIEEEPKTERISKDDVEDLF